MKKEKFKRNILLKNYTTFKIGGPAKYFFEAKNKKDLVEAIKTAKELKLDFFILGGGGNMLVSDKGFQGLVIKIQNTKFKSASWRTKLKISCESGLSLAKLVSESLKVEVTGMEWAVGIPGTVGGAIRGNAGAFEQSMGQIIKKVEVYDLKDLRFKIYELKDCKFKYRDSIFKYNKNLIIISAELEFKKVNKEEIRKKIVENLKWRRKHQPLEFPSAGSIFQNVKIKMKNEKLKSKIKKDKNLKVIIKNNIIPAGWLIEKCNLKGKKIGDAQISEKHANFIINLGDAKAEDVRKLIELAKKNVKRKFNIELEEEIEYLGF